MPLFDCSARTRSLRHRLEKPTPHAKNVDATAEERTAWNDRPRTPVSTSTRPRCTSTNIRLPESSRSRRPSRSATSATWRSPIRRASPRPAWRSATIPALAADYTGRANLVAVISNGTAVLGLGNIGPLASKPVMEGKAVLFKKFAGIDVFDIEIDAPDIERMVETVSALEPTFGGINLEDIKAPECFEVEERLKARMGIPVFHDDQHGTAIIVAAAVLNGLELAGKNDRATSRSSPRARALRRLPASICWSRWAPSVENIWVTDRFGVAYKGRVDEMDRWKDPYVKDTEARTLADVIAGADVFLGLSAAGVLKPELLEGHGGQAADPGARQSDARDHAGDGARGAARRDDLHRPLGFSQPGQQRPLLPLHLPRRARLRRPRHQRGDEDGGGARHRRACARGAVRRRGARLFGRDADLRARFPDPLAFRPAADPAHRAGRGQGGLRDAASPTRPIADWPPISTS